MNVVRVRNLCAVAMAFAIVGAYLVSSVDAHENTSLTSDLTAESIAIPTPASYKPWPKPVSPSIGKTYTYKVETRGTGIMADLAEFKTLAAQTLADSRGWVRAGATFREITSGTPAFTLVLASPAYIGSLSGCSAELSCRYGKLILINDVRWRNATDPWNTAGGTIRDYRHMVVNHEVGHFLGHSHENCPTPGALAPVMCQQSVNLQGCTFNPWPLQSELWLK